jgi:hypothetical protein
MNKSRTKAINRFRIGIKAIFGDFIGSRTGEPVELIEAPGKGKAIVCHENGYDIFEVDSIVPINKISRKTIRNDE